MASIIQLRRDTSTNWSSVNPILAEGEIGLELDTLAYKIGNGSTAWNNLGYQQLSGEFGAVLMNSINDPAPPPSGKMNLYSKQIAGRAMPKFIGNSGLDTVLQPAFFGNGIQIISPSASTALSLVGVSAPTVVGTLSHPALASTNLRTQTRRASVTSAATANAAAELRVAATQCWRGDAAGLGGFFMTTRFGLNSAVALQRSFIGLLGSTAAIATTQSPSLLTNCIGVGNDSTDANLQLMANDATGACLKVNLGNNFPANDINAVFELILFAPPNSAWVKYRVVNFTNSAVAEGQIAAADLPASTTFLSWHAYVNNGGTAAAVILDFMRFYLETDY